MNPSETFLEKLPLVEQIIRSICRSRGMDAAEAEEFGAFVKLRLVDNDYAIIRAFKGRSSFGTFITTVVVRLVNDYRKHEWGRWRYSAEAKRLGPVAIDIETLLVRDERSADDAFAIIRSTYPELTREEFELIAAKLPARYHAKRVDISEAASVFQKPDVAVHDRESAAHLSAIITAYIDALPKEDRLIFELRFESDMPVPQIAQSLHLDPQDLYRRLRRHLAELKDKLTANGMSASEVAELIGGDKALLDFHLKGHDIESSWNEEYETGGHTNSEDS